MLIGISGKIGSGKDTVGALIRHLVAVDKGISFNSKEDPFEVLKNTGMLPVSVPHVTGWEIKKFAGKLKQIVALLTGCRVEDLEGQEFKQKPLGKEWDYWFTEVVSMPPYSAKFNTKDEADRMQRVMMAAGNYGRILEPVEKSYTYRDLLQQVGTEAMRNVVHTNVWCNALFSDYIRQNTINLTDGGIVKSNYHPVMDAGAEDIYPFPNWIITDMRFPNEMAAVKERGGITIRVKRTQFLKRDSLPTHEHPSETALDNAEFDYVIDNDGTMEELVAKVKEILIKEKIINNA